MPVYVDERIIFQLQPVNNNWLKNGIKSCVSNVEEWNNDNGIILVSDAQLKNKCNQQIARRVLDNEGLVVLTGHVYPKTYASNIIIERNVYKISYPVHMNYNQVADMVKKNRFELILMNHSQRKIQDDLNLITKINERVVDL